VLAVVGNLNIDVWVHPVDRFPSVDEEALVDSMRVELAGTVGYVALAARALGQSVLPVSTIGDDALGQALAAAAVRAQIEMSAVDVLEDRQTPISLVFIDSDGGRSILSTLGAHEDMDMQIVSRHDEDIARCDEVLLCGSYLLPKLSPSHLLSYARGLQQRGQVVVFDPSWDPLGWPDEMQQATFDLLRSVDIYMPNQEELCRLTRCRDWRDGIDAIARKTREIVLKRGAQGATFVRGTERVDVPAFKIAAHNSIGAGDVFDAGYLHARHKGWTPQQRLEFASALAAIVVSQRGTRRYPDEESTCSFLADRLGESRWLPSGPQ